MWLKNDLFYLAHRSLKALRMFLFKESGPTADTEDLSSALN